MLEHFYLIVSPLVYISTICIRSNKICVSYHSMRVHPLVLCVFFFSLHPEVCVDHFLSNQPMIV